MQGMSVIVCCRNGAARLPTTLSHLKAQEPSGTPLEVLLVDNDSADDSAEVARLCWDNNLRNCALFMSHAWEFVMQGSEA